MYPPRWRAYLAIRVITGRYLAHRTASIVSECTTKSGATTVIDHCLLLRRALILCIILRFSCFFLFNKLTVATGKYCLAYDMAIYFFAYHTARFLASTAVMLDCSIVPLVLSLNVTSYLLHVNDR